MSLAGPFKMFVANSVDPDQTAPLGAVCPGSTLFFCMQKLVVDVSIYMLWLSGGVLELRLKGRRLDLHWCHCVVSLSKTHLSLLSTGSTHEDLSRHN